MCFRGLSRFETVKNLIVNIIWVCTHFVALHVRLVAWLLNPQRLRWFPGLYRRWQVILYDSCMLCWYGKRTCHPETKLHVWPAPMYWLASAKSFSRCLYLKTFAFIEWRKVWHGNHAEHWIKFSSLSVYRGISYLPPKCPCSCGRWLIPCWIGMMLLLSRLYLLTTVSRVDLISSALSIYGPPIRCTTTTKLLCMCLFSISF